jgi:hypothetical protein
LQGQNNIHFAENQLIKGTHNLPTILIVDDDLQNLKLLEGMLFQIDCKLIKATI